MRRCSPVSRMGGRGGRGAKGEVDNNETEGRQEEETERKTWRESEFNISVLCFMAAEQDELED